MKPGSGQSSRADPRQAKKQQKGKKALPTMAYFKSFKNVQPVPPSPAWTGDEAMTIKPAPKPIFEDPTIATLMAEKYSSVLRMQQVFPPDAVLVDLEAPIAFENPEVDPSFVSALFICLSKGRQFFDSGSFEVYPQEINPIGKYCMKMYENGSPTRLFFDDRIGCNGDPPECALLRDSDKRIMFPTLCHKAWLRFNKFEPFTSLDVVTAFTGFVPYDIPVDWQNLHFWFGRPDSLVALYIKEERNQWLGHDRLFHILDVVDLDQHRKFVKLQCPGAQWRGRFSGFEEDTKHWTNQVRVILEIDPETAAQADYFWMIYEDLIENFDSIMVFSPTSSFTSNIRAVHSWVPKEAQFYTPPPPKLLRCTGPGRLRICTAPLLTTAPVNDVKLVLKYFSWNAQELPVALEVNTPSWKMTMLDIKKSEELLEVEAFSKGGFILQILGIDTQAEWVEYKDVVTSVHNMEGDLPFYVCMDDYAASIFKQRFELIGKITFNIDQPGNLSYAVYVTNALQKAHMVAMLFNNDMNDATSTTKLRSEATPLTPNNRGYTLLVFGLYTETIFTSQPADLVGRWRLKMFSDVPLSDIVETAHSNYTEIEGDCCEMDETHQINRNVLTGGCDAVVVLETSQPLSLTLTSILDEAEVNCVRGIGFVILPTCRIPGDKEQSRLIVRGVSTEHVTGFSWKLRIWSTAPVVCKEDTAPAEKTAAAIAAWEKKRSGKAGPGGKSRSSVEAPTTTLKLDPPEFDPKVIATIKADGEGHVLTEEQLAELNPMVPESTEVQSISEITETASAVDPGDPVREQITALTTMMNDKWDQYDQKRAQITKLFTPTPPKPD